MLDTIIRGGMIYDGNGGEGQTGDVGIADGRIVSLGARITDAAKEVIDADGAIVTPAFVDIHTHYDGQVTWDGAMEPSASHGVGTIVMGNCGVGFAPVTPGGHQDLIDLMEGVEDIPGTALYEAVPWGEWETYPEYLDYLATREYAIDVTSMITHGAVRSYVMGDPERANDPPTIDEIERMGVIVEEAIRAGSVGFSTSRVLGHRSIHGMSVPGTFAQEAELRAIAEGMGRARGGVLQAIPGGALDFDAGEAPLLDEVDWLCRLSALSGRKTTFSLVQKRKDPDLWRQVIAKGREAKASGAQLFPQVGSRGSGFIFSLGTYHKFMARPSYIALKHLPVAERAVAMRDPAVKARVLGEQDIVPQFPGKMESLIPALPLDMDLTFPLYAGSNFEWLPEESFGAAVAGGQDGGAQQADALLYDYLTQGAGDAFAISIFGNYGRFNLDHIREMQLDEDTVVGLSDAGAHVGAILDAVGPTYQLAYWGRDRTRGPTLPLSRIVEMQTRRNARLFGLDDRGVLAPGMRADVNVIDFDNLALGTLEVRHDLPLGGMRLMQSARGYMAAYVNGTQVRRNDEDTGARPGRLVRGKLS